MTLTDNEWSEVQRAAAGDGQAYARLIARHQSAIAQYMWRFTRDRGRWEELVHDVFVEAYLSLRGYRGQSPLEHWLRRIATRVGYRHWTERNKARQRSGPLETAETPAAADTNEAASQAAETVHRLLAKLAPRDRLVLTLLHLEEQSIAEIASLTGWSRIMVKVQAHRARAKLKRLLEAEGSS